jgi:serine/threonine protein kinase
MQEQPVQPAPTPPDPDDPLIGTIIGDRYRVEAELGSGGMGTVYRAEHVMMEKRVALKVLHPSLAVVGSVMDRFQREAVALSRIEHPNVVAATDFGKLKNGSYYLALEYVDGRNLAETLQTEGLFDVRRALHIAYQIAEALHAAHARGIVHRDLKPHNVMLTGQPGAETVKVLDFGLAKLRSKNIEGSTANIGAVFGTPHYMAPEQVASTNVDARADLYSLGIMMFEMLTGRRPFDADSPRGSTRIGAGRRPTHPRHSASQRRRRSAERGLAHVARPRSQRR